MTRPELHLVVPGGLDQRTGGTIYDRRIVEGLRGRGWDVVVHGTGVASKSADEDVGARLADTLARIPDGTTVVIDGLALGGQPGVVRAQRPRLQMVALVHSLVADDVSLGRERRERSIRLELDALEACHRIIVTSAYMAAHLGTLGVGGASTRTVPPGTDPAVPAEGPPPDTPPRLLCVAAVTPGKGQDVLVRALAAIADVPWTCVCAGSLTRDAGFADAVRAEVREAGLAGRVELRGECDASTIDQLYLTSSVFVLPSYHESYGMALTEAMARGLPVVSTTGGAIEQTVPSDAGVLVAPGDHAALADALTRLLVDEPGRPGSAAARRIELGAAGRRHAARLPDWDATVDAFEAALQAPVEDA